jgi:EAL domain-containing protein (putative c-di-GMP-specific phosphodiesterase class I)/GGDEF domain-containing protein
VTSLSSIQQRQFLGHFAFVVVAFASLAFWAVELSLAMASHDERIEEVLVAYQGRLLAAKAEAFHGLFREIYQTGRTISLLPAIRGAAGANRTSEGDSVVAQGRLSTEADRTLQQIYANLAAYAQVSEIYFTLDGFAPERGEVPFFMYDELAGRRELGHAHSSPAEQSEYREILSQLDWFRAHAPRFAWTADLNAIPARISSPLPTCDDTQQHPSGPADPRDRLGLVHSVPVFDAASGDFKGQVSIIVRSNVLEALLVGVPFLPVTPADLSRMRDEGWTMPPPSDFVLVDAQRSMQIADRRSTLMSQGLAAARADPAAGGRWASQRVDIPGIGAWELHHHLADAEIEQRVAGIRSARRNDIVGRFLLLIVLGGFLAGGGWLLRSSRRELVRMAHHDQLTGLPNRSLFFDHLASGMVRARRSGKPMGLFFLDVADLTAVNDRHGHQGGDKLLVDISNRLMRRLRSTDSIARGSITGGALDDATMPGSVKVLLSRLGGDEFAILCEDLHHADDLIVIAERIIGCVDERFAIGGESVEIALNVGAALFPDDASDAERLLMNADNAMHECKATGARYVLFNENMRLRAERQHRLVLELIDAIRLHQFELHYQPKATIADGRVASLEALIRWRHPTLGLVSPAEFIPICERNGMIIELGQWIIEQACRDLRRLAEAGHADLKLSVNVSVRQLWHGGFVEFLGRTLRDTGTEAGRLILEMTETMVMQDLPKGRQALLALKALGVSLALDDFGAGYSSMTYLQHLPLDCLKIDKSLVDGMVDARSIHVVDTVIRLAQGLKLTTVAEGIETEEQRQLLGRLGCDMIQGYLLSRPLPLPTILDWLGARETCAA